MERIETSVFTRQARTGTIFLLFLYPKNVRADLTPRELAALRRLVEDEPDEE